MQKFNKCPPDYKLHPRRIDIWQLPLSGEPKSHDILSADEVARANRFHFAKHKRRFINAHMKMRVILGKYTGVSPNDLIFNANKYGKPELQDQPNIQFNLSHSKDTALLAVGYKHPVGIDLEYFSARPYTGIGNQLFATDEQHTLAKSHWRMRPITFFTLWAQKEAFIKACGMGLSYPTQQFTTSVFKSDNQAIVDKDGNTWSIYTFMNTVSCCAAICHHPQIKDMRFITGL